jgi:hypothetical protein
VSESRAAACAPWPPGSPAARCATRAVETRGAVGRARRGVPPATPASARRIAQAAGVAGCRDARSSRAWAQAIRVSAVVGPPGRRGVATNPRPARVGSKAHTPRHHAPRTRTPVRTRLRAQHGISVAGVPTRRRQRAESWIATGARRSVPRARPGPPTRVAARVQHGRRPGDTAAGSASMLRIRPACRAHVRHCHEAPGDPCEENAAGDVGPRSPDRRDRQRDPRNDEAVRARPVRDVSADGVTGARSGEVWIPR